MKCEGKPAVQFVANRWLATNEGDGALFVDLIATGGEGAKLVLHRYKVEVYTSDIR